MAAAKAGGGGGAGGQKISEVDSDRLWRDRVSQELMYQQKWVEEYGFMLEDEKRTRLQAGSASFSNQGNSASTTLSSTAGSSPKKSSTLKFSSTPSVGSTASIQQSSYKVLPSPEIKNDPSPFRRRRHPP
jgi:hypothetical protein